MRIFFWASIPGHPLPKYPQPTHVFSGRRSKGTCQIRRSAPHRAVTVGDAISDLPSFDWSMTVCGESAVVRTARDQRACVTIQVPVPAGIRSRIGPDVQTYSSHIPLSKYQRELRKNVKKTSVENAYTHRFEEQVMNRILRIPIWPDANHSCLPRKYQLGFCKGKGEDLYRRLDYEEAFQACLCKLNPSGYNARVSYSNPRTILSKLK